MSFANLAKKHWDGTVLFSALLELTYRCNLDCVICYNDRALSGKPLSPRRTTARPGCRGAFGG